MLELEFDDGGSTAGPQPFRPPLAALYRYGDAGPMVVEMGPAKRCLGREGEEVGDILPRPSKREAQGVADTREGDNFIILDVKIS